MTSEKCLSHLGIWEAINVTSEKCLIVTLSHLGIWEANSNKWNISELVTNLTQLTIKFVHISRTV